MGKRGEKLDGGLPRQGVHALRIALFTAFSPEIGGGSAQLRSHLRFLPELDVTWYYLAEQPAKQSHENWKWLGERLNPGELLSDMSARSRFLPGSKQRVREIVAQMSADLYWVLGHYEGISVAAELQEQNKPVHLTIHDDPFGTWARSNRYKWFQPLLLRTFPRVLRGAKNVDVTSWGMRNLYRQVYGVKCCAVYLHVAELPSLNVTRDSRKLTMGHIGTLYQHEPFERFLAASKQIAAEQQRALRVIRIGASPELDTFSERDPEIFEAHGDLEEETALPLLASCDLLYAMYPSGRKFERFRRTSLPIKLSSYVQAQRPIFAHAPRDSTLARIVGPWRVGKVCASDDQAAIKSQLGEALQTAVPRENFERLRNDLMGLDQVKQLGAALRHEDWSAYPEHDFRA